MQLGIEQGLANRGRPAERNQSNGVGSEEQQRQALRSPAPWDNTSLEAARLVVLHRIVVVVVVVAVAVAVHMVSVEFVAFVVGTVATVAGQAQAVLQAWIPISKTAAISFGARTAHR